MCLDTACGATPSRELARIPIGVAPAAQPVSAIQQELVTRDNAGKEISRATPLDAVRTFAQLVALSPVPITWLDAANNASPIPRYRAVREPPLTAILEDAQAFDASIGRVGRSTFGAFDSRKDVGVAVGRVAVGTSDPIGDGTPNRPLTVLAHEMLHTFGLPHADQAQGGCGGAGVDAGFPSRPAAWPPWGSTRGSCPAAASAARRTG